MRLSDRRLFVRSFDVLEQLLTSRFYGFSRPDLSILDISPPESPLARELSRMGYRVQRFDCHVTNSEHIDLMVCDGPYNGPVNLSEMVRMFQPGTQVILMRQPIRRNSQSDPRYFNPSTLGKYRIYPVERWTELLFGLGTYLKMVDCPVVKIRPTPEELSKREKR